MCFSVTGYAYLEGSAVHVAKCLGIHPSFESGSLNLPMMSMDDPGADTNVHCIYPPHLHSMLVCAGQQLRIAIAEEDLPSLQDIGHDHGVKMTDMGC
jgi:hypothetical protein